MAYYSVIEITIKYKQQLRNSTILACALFRKHSNVMHRSKVQAFQDPPLCRRLATPCLCFCFFFKIRYSFNFFAVIPPWLLKPSFFSLSILFS
jgi:hypothetical protein